MIVEVTVNGTTHRLPSQPGQRLLDLLRVGLALTGTKEGCSEGECGACTVLVDGTPMLACMMLAWQAHERTVVTVEGLAPMGGLAALQHTFVDQNAIQCGFCTPGMLVSATALLRDNPQPTDTEIRTALAGNLCRCTGYAAIVEAVMTAARKAVTP